MKITYDKVHIVVKSEGLEKDLTAKDTSATADPTDKFLDTCWAAV